MADSALNTTQQPALAEMRDRATRENCLLRAGRERKKMMAMIPALHSTSGRDSRTAGETAWFSSFAAWKIADQMAKTPEAALNFSGKLFQRRVNVLAMN